MLLKSLHSASKLISFCGMLKSLFMFMSSGLSTLTGQHTPSSHTLVPVIYDECVLVLGHPLQLVPICRNVGAHWYLRDSIPDKIRMSLVTSWSWNGIHKHKPSYFSTAIVNLVKLFQQENFSLFQRILHTCKLLLHRFNCSFLLLKMS